jgi:hypothetical protein
MDNLHITVSQSLVPTGTGVVTLSSSAGSTGSSTTSAGSPTSSGKSGVGCLQANLSYTFWGVLVILLIC